MSSNLDRRIAIRTSLRLTFRFVVVLALAAAALAVIDWLLFESMMKDGCRSMSEDGTPVTAAEMQHIVRQTFWANIPPVLTMLVLLGFGGAFLLTYAWTARMRAIVRTVQDVTKTGDFGRRVEIDGRGGDAPAVHLVNTMLEMGDGMMRRMRESLDNVAHELRTPLTRMRATVERALTLSTDPTVCHAALSDSLEESENMLQVVDTLLDIAEAETGVMRLRKADMPAADLVRSVTDLYEYVAEDQGVRIETDLASDLVVHGDQERLRQVLANLVDNALKYGEGGEVVRIQGRAVDGGVRIQVVDRGPGIPPEELPRIWTRLYRGRPRGQTRQRGLGLGLSFVKAIVEAHGGSVAVDSRVGEGSTFTVELPLGEEE